MTATTFKLSVTDVIAENQKSLQKSVDFPGELGIVRAYVWIIQITAKTLH